MGIQAVLCTLSPKRLAQIEAEPEVIADLIEAREEEKIPGLLDLERAWDALRRILGPPDGSGPLADLVTGAKGRKIGPDLGYGPARLIDPDQIKALVAAFPKDPGKLVKDGYKELLGKGVHGGYGAEQTAKGDSKWLKDKVKKTQEQEVEELTGKLEALLALYRKAAAEGHSMLVAIV